jgi:hypothetical protein
MKKMIIFFLAVTSLTACKKDKTTDPVVYAEENPIPGFLATTGFDQKSEVSNYPSPFEEGFSFKATTKGKINALVIKLPVANSSLRITIWDNTSKAILRTENVNISTANTETAIVINPFNIEKDKAYFISMNTKNDYVRTRTNGTPITYPIVSGNISILGVAFVLTPNQEFPTDLSQYAYYGDIGFKFQRTE